MFKKFSQSNNLEACRTQFLLQFGKKRDNLAKNSNNLKNCQQKIFRKY